MDDYKMIGIDTSFQASSCKKIKEFFDEDKLTDVELITNGKTIKCHRTVLASCSPYFEAMFTGNFKESKEKRIEIQEIEHGILKALIDFCYEKTLVISENNAVDFLSAACFLQIDYLIYECCEFIIARLDFNNSISIASVASKLSLIDVHKKAINFIENFFYKIIKTAEFKNTDEETLKTVLESDFLNVTSEKEAYDAVITWIEHEKDRHALLPQLLERLRLHFLKDDELNEISGSSLISTNVDSNRIIQQALAFRQMGKKDVKRPRLSREKIRPRNSYPGIIFYLGGEISNGFQESLIRIYNWLSNKWEVIDVLVDNIRYCGCLWYKGAIVRVGGLGVNFCERRTRINYPVGWNKELQRFKVGEMAVPRRSLGVCCIDDVIYAIGGICDNYYLNTVEACSVKDGKWQVKSSMNHCRGDVAVAELRGSIIAIGGSDGVRSLDTCELYDPTEDVWRNIAPLNTPRHSAGAVTVDGFVYVFGGLKNREFLGSVEKYVPEKNQWIILSPMKYPRSEVGVARIGRNIYVIAGIEKSRHSERMEIYNVDDDSWKVGPSVRKCKVGGGVVTGFMYPEDMEKLKRNIMTGDLLQDF